MVSAGQSVSKYFIAGTPRSGTTWLAKSLNTHEQIAVFGESGFWGRNYIDCGNSGLSSDQLKQILDGVNCLSVTSLNCDAKLSLRNIVDACINSDKEFCPEDIYSRWCARIARREDVDSVVEKTPHHIRSAGRIFNVYPSAKMVALLREPFGFVRSYKFQGARKPRAVRRRFNKKYDPIGTSLLYASYISAVREAKKKFGERVLVVRYEEVQSDEDNVLQKVESFFDVRAGLAKSVHDRNSSFSGGVDGELTEDEKRCIATIVSFLGEGRGDDVRREGGVKSVLRFVPGFVEWGLWNIRNLDKSSAGDTNSIVKSIVEYI